MWSRVRSLTAAVSVAVCVVTITGCGTEETLAPVVIAPRPAAAEEPEPTTTYVAPVEPTPLFDLLRITADSPIYTSAAEQVATIGPDAIVLGEVVSVAADPGDPADPVPGGLNGAWLTVRPLHLAGTVPVRDDGLIVVEMYRPARVSAEWLAQATDFGGETVFIVKDVGEPGVVSVTDSMGVYRNDPNVGLRATAAGDTPAPPDLRSLSPQQAFDVLSSLLR